MLTVEQVSSSLSRYLKQVIRYVDENSPSNFPLYVPKCTHVNGYSNGCSVPWATRSAQSLRAPRSPTRDIAAVWTNPRAPGYLCNSDPPLAYAPMCRADRGLRACAAGAALRLCASGPRVHTGLRDLCRRRQTTTARATPRQSPVPPALPAIARVRRQAPTASRRRRPRHVLRQACRRRCEQRRRSRLSAATNHILRALHRSADGQPQASATTAHARRKELWSHQ